ncbi:hypothetical protein AW040_23020 (plasmid) [Vibrio parahaemolyticus]|jgi:hypothetical protein|uniref:Uncharacterized protein n=1 Tax=Vibrio tasmaniensis TaxID=212663 RepID=A0A0H3ZSV2_9VIBR|nr:hypothetical protein [Vibrio tasmaniensis]EGQ9547210.1 hypothetical protein [Vibrio parahaemolyticus]NNN43088.1 hypothetical protein [Vibrio sp. 2-2(2)]NNN90565.1 hypothetical protein [Vibrio sp. 2-2(9)]NNO06127.1 hypothetical protein [Vibrio sp. 7-5(1-a)]
MFCRVLFTALSCSALFIAISDNVPHWVNVLGWIYILGMLCVGILALKAEQIISWCDKQFAKKRK